MIKRVLVVDDEPTIVELVKLRLMKEGYEVETATNGEHALEIAKNQKFDLAILDIMMPDMDGYELLKHIRQDLNLGFPIMFLTAKSSDNDVWEGWQTGADYYITKPFTGESLLRGVKLCLKETA